jgi:arsenical pump membrane protein
VQRGRVLFAAGAVALAAAAVVAVQPLGTLRGTMLLVLVLPPIAHALDRLGWAELLAVRVAGRRPGADRVLVAYGTWLGISALLTLDVAAVVATPVGLAVARRWRVGERVHLGAAILGSNVGSMLFPFSNLTNLLLVAGTGIGFTTFVATAALPQLLAAVAVGALLVRRVHTAQLLPGRSADVPVEILPGEVDVRPPRPDRVTLLAGGIAVFGAVAAVAVGIAGGDVALVFAAVAAAVAALALTDGAATPTGLLRSIPISGVVVVLAAAIARQPMIDLAAGLPHLDATLPPLLALPAIALVGGLVAAAINNLPAAAFGSVWLVGSSPAAVVAFLLGANILNLLTPHGSLATILGRNLATAAGAHLPTSVYLRGAWRYAVAGTIAGLVPLVLLPR